MIPWLLRYWKPVAIAVVVVGALTASYVKGRSDANTGWELKAAQAELARVTALAQAVEKARKEERDAQALADDVRSQPVVRVRCYADRPSLPGAGTGVVGDDLQDGGGARQPESLGTAELQEFLAAAVANHGVPVR